MGTWIKDGQIVDPVNGLVEMLDIIVENGRISKIFCISLFLLMISWKEYFFSSCRRSSSRVLKSRKVSTPPIISPRWFLSAAAEMLIGIRRPSASII